jgi:LPS export ABC transporter protein LptC
LIVIGLYWFSQGNDIVDELAAVRINQGGGLTLENIHYVQDNPDEGVNWILDAGKVKFTEDKQRISFDNFELKLSPDSEHSVRIEGDSGNFNRNSNKLELKGGLKGYTNEGYSLGAEHVIFRQSDGILSSDESVELSGPFMTVKGKGLYLDLNEMNLKILNNVTTFIDRALLIP